MDQYAALRDVHAEYRSKPLDRGVMQAVLDRFGLDLTAAYFDQPMANPIVVASGQKSLANRHLDECAAAGWGGTVLKTFIGEDRDGHCSMVEWRKPPYTPTRIHFESDDAQQERGIVVWTGRGATQDWTEYQRFAAHGLEVAGQTGLVVIASMKANFPRPGEAWLEDEWTFTTQQLLNLGYRLFEIDFSPTLGASDRAAAPDTVLDWYRTSPALMRRAAREIGREIVIYSKIMNLEFGFEFQQAMIQAAIEGGCDGVVIANRFFRPDLKAAYGGPQLKERNLRLIRQVRQDDLRLLNGRPLPIVATGGVYTGRDALQYLLLGADCVELLSFIMQADLLKKDDTTGVLNPYGKDVKRFNEFDAVLYKLLLHPEDGLIAGLLHIQGTYRVSRVLDVRTLYRM